MSEEQDLIPGLPDDVAVQCLLKLDYAKINVFASVCRRWRQELLSPDFLAFLLEEDRCSKEPRYISYIALFEPKSEQWHRLPPIPTDEEFEYYELVQAGHRLVAVTTWSDSYSVPTVYIYDFFAGGWRLGAPRPSECNGYCRMPACASDGVRRVFLAGGSHFGDYGETSSTAVSYDVDGDTWYELPDMPEPRDVCDGYFHDGVFIVTGNPHFREDKWDDSPILHNRAEQYNVSTGIWSSVPEYTPFILGSSEGGRGGFLAPDGNYYIYHVDETKLMVKQGQSWAFVGNLPADVNAPEYWVPIASREGFVMARKWDDHDKIVYILSLKADRDHNIPCKAVKMPSDFRGVITSGCCFKFD